MMEGIMFYNKMCGNIIEDEIMARIHTVIYANSLLKKECKEMNSTEK